MIALDTNILIYACDKADSTGVISQIAVWGRKSTPEV
jgi:hypothetical protein